jgi:hypothetical protein
LRLADNEGVEVSYKEKMRKHIKASERWDARIDAMEAREIVAAGGDPALDEYSRTGNNRQADAMYAARKALEDNPWYKRAVGKVVSHREWANMYALAQLVDWSEESGDR